MNNLKIKESIKAYKKYLEQNNQAMEDLKARKEKISFYQKFKKDVLYGKDNVCFRSANKG